jgi:hypothetical protein
MRPRQAILVLENLRSNFSGPLHRKGVELSSDDTQTTLDVYQQWILLMMDLGYLHPETLLRDAQRLLTDMVSNDVLELNNAFAELLHLVRIKEIKGFKALCRRISGHLYHLIKVDVSAMSSGDVYSAGRLVNLFSYTGRLTLNDIDLTQQCLQDYVRIEDEMSSSVPSHLVHYLNKYIRKWMKSFDPSRIQPQHGPGGVAGHGRCSYQVKYKDLTYDEMLTYAFGAPNWSEGPVRSSLDRISQTIFVPKSYKTFRTISMESSTLQYLQQGVWKEIDRLVAGDGYLKARIGFHDQDRNQLLAKEGSISRNYATIDLSAASDSVSYSLVKKLFRGTKLLRYLVTTRSSRTLLPDGRLIDLKKFAPMGSALCFPIETIIFASICEFVTQEHGVFGKYSVFGDDIIVPTQCVEDLMLILETLGFTPNRSKSFYKADCWFRESCGAEYCDGFDVTPMRVSRKYKSRERLVHQAGLIEMSNTAYSKGFRYLRYFFLQKLRKSGWEALFSPTELLGDSYTNYHLQRRWNSSLQKIEARATALVAKTIEVEDESLRLRHWFESTQSRVRVKTTRNRKWNHKKPTSFDEGFSASVGKMTVLTQNCWRTKPYECHDQAFIDYHLQ